MPIALINKSQFTSLDIQFTQNKIVIRSHPHIDTCKMCSKKQVVILYILRRMEDTASVHVDQQQARLPKEGNLEQFRF